MNDNKFKNGGFCSMVVLFAASSYFTRGKATGGFPIYIYRVTTSLAKLGHTPIVVACGTTNKHYERDGVEIYIVECPFIENPIKCIEMGCRELHNGFLINKKIKEIMKKTKIDIIQFTSLSALSICYAGQVPAVMRLSSYAKMSYITYQTLDKSVVWVKVILERLAATRCNAIFAPSANTAKTFARDIGRKVSVIESPFTNDVDLYDESVYEDYLKGKKYVLYFGRLYTEKGIAVIADILQEFLKQNPQYYMVCCGHAEIVNGKKAVEMLREAAGENVDRFIYIKELPHETLYPVIRHAEFVILPSFSENLSNACMEAMYFEKVVVGTDGASFEQLIDDGKNGLLCKINDSDSLLSKMNEAALMTEQEKMKMGRKARRRIDQMAPEVAVKKLLKYYHYIIKMYFGYRSTEVIE